MSATYRTLLVSPHEASRALLERLVEGSDIVVDDVVPPDSVIASVARRAPDVIVVDVDNDVQSMTQVCNVLKANPVTVLLPLLALSRSAKQRLAAFEAGVDDFL